MSLLEIVGTIGFGLTVGIFAAMFGVGGGLLMVPFMVLVLGQSQHLAEGTSLLVMIPTAIAGGMVHRKGGFIDLRTAGALGLGGALGALGGALLALELEAAQLSRLFGIVVILAGTRLLVQGLRGEGGRGTPHESRNPG
ncbi:MAG: uncharacterized protein QOG54_2356 [Actinomycetota bacterium]|jgi:uncharacterized membrane protein YfcA|nr:uncharacterized protein [Actinomycetota bacterium]